MAIVTEVGSTLMSVCGPALVQARVAHLGQSTASYYKGGDQSMASCDLQLSSPLARVSLTRANHTTNLLQGARKS